ncbi:MAG: hypothetical protein HQM10_24970 [Candidatus Riflebacteria bacterium]|nr:hypothetical protein [Candidatus Riflebacteria bacterium]
MKNWRIRLSLFSAVIIFSVIFLSGCGGGGGSGGSGGGIGLYEVPFVNKSAARISSLGVGYDISASIQERNNLNFELLNMKTYRSFFTGLGTDINQSSYFYQGSPGFIYGYMFDFPGTTSGNIKNALVNDSSYNISSRDPKRLQPNETRTISTKIMVGYPGQSRPSGFLGIFITNSEYKEWVSLGKRGIRFYVTWQAFDAKSNNTYNIDAPLEAYFDYNLTTDPYDGETDPYSGGTGNTDPYNGGTGNTDPYNGGTGNTDPYSGGTGNTDPYSGGNSGTDPYAPSSGYTNPYNQ